VRRHDPSNVSFEVGCSSTGEGSGQFRPQATVLLRERARPECHLREGLPDSEDLAARRDRDAVRADRSFRHPDPHAAPHDSDSGGGGIEAHRGEREVQDDDDGCHPHGEIARRAA